MIAPGRSVPGRSSLIHPAGIPHLSRCVSCYAADPMPKGRKTMNRLLVVLGALAAGALLVPGDADAQRFGGGGRGFGGGGGFGGGFRGGGAMIGGGGGFRGGAIAARPGGIYRGAGLGGYRTAGVYRPVGAATGIVARRSTVPVGAMALTAPIIAAMAGGIRTTGRRWRSVP